uniref:Transducer of regulated CREB activity N-terminal domain-containing protein n=1 Tax=Musca domestica TaxID=7370 RepID=A0A1I8NC18_MUSDO
MANPRKFSEKIALQKQKQAEGTAEFEKIMNEVKATRVLEISPNNADGTETNIQHGNTNISGGGSGTSSGASGGGASPDANAGGGTLPGSSPTAYRESRGRSMGGGPMRRPSERKQDRSPYGSTAGLILGGMPSNTQNTYLSPPMDTSWRRSNSDSALHQTLNMAEGNFGTSPQTSLMEDLNSLHTNYHQNQSSQHQQQQHHSHRSHSPNIGRSYSPQAQRRKSTIQQNQQQQQLHLQRIQMQQQQAQQQHIQQHMHSQQMQQHLQPQQQCNAKFNNTSIPGNVMNYANTGSLPDLTSVHFAAVSNISQMMQQQPQQQQHTLSPMLSPNHSNGCQDRDQSSSPFSPPNLTRGGCGPPSPYHQQENSPTSAVNTSTSNNPLTSPHLSFTNLSVQSPVSVSQQGNAHAPNAFTTLPTLGAASSTGNLTDYRQPLNPPSPGSSPGLLTSGPSNDIHTSAPASPIRHCPSNLANSSTAVGGVGNSTRQNQQIQQQAMQQTAFGAIDSTNQGYNTLHPAFHNHFEQFSLGDSCQSPQNYDTLEIEDYVASATSGTQTAMQHTFHNKMFDLGDLNSSSANTTRTQSTNTTSNCNNNNNISGTSSDRLSLGSSQHFQHTNNNSSTNASNTNGPTPCRTALINNNDRQDILSANSSPIPSPLSHCSPSPSSPLPIPMSSHSPAHHQQLSLSVQTSPHHSPLHSPHHNSSPLSVSSPGLTMMGGNISPVPSPSAHILNHHQHNHINSQNPSQLNHGHTTHSNSQHNQHQALNVVHTPTTTTNIPQIIFSDYSSSRDIFDNLDLDLGQIDEPGLQMLSDQNPIMIADPSIEDSFRRDLN